MIRINKRVVTRYDAQLMNEINGINIHEVDNGLIKVTMDSRRFLAQGVDNEA